MGGRTAGRRGARRDLNELVRLACTIEPVPRTSRPARLAAAPTAATALGALLIVLALVLALRAVLTAPASPAPTAPAATQTPHAPTSQAPTGQATDTGAPLAPSDPAATTSTGGSGANASQGDEAGALLVVHVTGAVTAPGVVRLPAGARVVDAVEAAGGAVPEAATEALNLARPLSDGEQVHVPRAGEEPAPQTQGEAAGAAASAGSVGPGGASATTGGTGGGGGTSRSATGLVDVNTADATTLQSLPGIGPALAQRIVTYRTEHGPFASVEDLTDVPGIGQAKLTALREAATV